jgi:hypothetical protein
VFTVLSDASGARASAGRAQAELQGTGPVACCDIALEARFLYAFRSTAFLILLFASQLQGGVTVIGERTLHFGPALPTTQYFTVVTGAAFATTQSSPAAVRHAQPSANFVGAECCCHALLSSPLQGHARRRGSRLSLQAAAAPQTLALKLNGTGAGTFAEPPSSQVTPQSLTAAEGSPSAQSVDPTAVLQVGSFCLLSFLLTRACPRRLIDCIDFV